MEQTIDNKIARSGLIVLDLEKFMPNEEDIAVFDLAPFLFKGLIIKEKDFRTAMDTADFTIYSQKIIGVFCSVDTIIPNWVYMLIAAKLSGIAKEIYFGNKQEVIDKVTIRNINLININNFENAKLLLKGCGDRNISGAIYLAASQKLLPAVKSLMYGEPCSSVPVYKKK